MGEANVVTTSWRQVEVGRVILFTEGVYEGKLAAIVQIIDHKRVLVDNPTEKVPRHSARLSDATLTHIVIPKLPRAAGTGALKKLWTAEGVDEKWSNSNWAKSRESSKKRRNLTDFERYQVLRARKAQRFEVRKSLAKVRAAA